MSAVYVRRAALNEVQRWTDRTNLKFKTKGLDNT